MRVTLLVFNGLVVVVFVVVFVGTFAAREMVEAKAQGFVAEKTGILFNSFLGWGYPVLLLITFLGLCWEYLKVANSRQSAPAS